MIILTDLFKIYLSYRESRNVDDIVDRVDQTTLCLEHADLPMRAGWLWLILKLAEDTRFQSFLSRYAQEIDKSLDIVVKEWDTPSSDIWGETGISAVYISNLGIIYGALYNAKNLLGKTVLQKTMTEIRDFVFDNGLSQGSLVRLPSSDEVSVDLLATVVPFGLFSSEDLIVVEAVDKIERELVSRGSVRLNSESVSISAAASAWIAWYFAVKGNLAQSKRYLLLTQNCSNQVSNTDRELANVIASLVQIEILEKENSQEALSLIHSPYGNDNPYQHLDTERIPRDPEVGERVRIRCQVWPDSNDFHCKVTVTTQNRRYQVTCHRLVAGSNSVWEADIGSFEYRESVSYFFELWDQNECVTKSALFHFSPYAPNYVSAITSVQVRNDSLVLKGLDARSVQNPYLVISDRAGALQLDVHVHSDTHLVNENRYPPSLTYTEDDQEIIIKGNTWSCKIKKDPFQMTVYDRSGRTIICKHQAVPQCSWLVNSDLEVKDVGWNFFAAESERFYAGGERYHQFEYRGSKMDCYVYNQYRDQGSKTYLPVPFIISSHGYGLFIDTPYYSSLDMGASLDDLFSAKCDISKVDGSGSFVIFLGSPKEMCSQFIRVTGKPSLPPVWAFGPWMSSNNWDRDSVVREQVRLTNQYQIPSTVIVLEQWSDEATYYAFNDAEYEVKDNGEAHTYDEYKFQQWGRWPSPKGLVNYLNENGLKLILWQIPIQKTLNGQKHLQKDADEKFMIKQGYMVKTEEGSPYRIPEGWFKDSLVMDFSHPEGAKWWFEKRQYLLDIGVAGFKTDGGEFIFGKRLKFHDGRDGSAMRNLYPNDYIGAYYRFAVNSRGEDTITFSRAGYTGAQLFPAHWAGDERSTFDAFQHSLIAGLSSGLSGILFWGWDLAGFNGDIPSAELFIRSSQMAAFCPIMQYHAESKGEFNQDRTPWNIAERTRDVRVLDCYRYFANVRMNLLPYIYSQAKLSVEEALPLMRSLFMEFPHDTSCNRIYDQYLFGESILVAPVIEQGATERMVYFPEGDWIHLWTGENVKGPVYKRCIAPLDSLIAFVRQDSAIICNTDASLSLGSWVGNSIDQYCVPSLRLYPSENIRTQIVDHLGITWKVCAARDESNWKISVKTCHKHVHILLPFRTVANDEFVIINGNKYTLNEFKHLNGYVSIELE